MRVLPKTAFSLLLAILAVAPAYSQDRASSHPNRSSFRYIIVNNGLLHNGRLVLVLLDGKSFSESHLRELFELISKRFPEPDELHVGVFTNLEQIPTPEEEDFSKLLPAETELAPGPDLEKYSGAVYVRHADNESFSYVMVSPTTVEKTVIIRGVDLLHSKKKYR